MTRALGPEGFGVYSTIFAYLFLFTILADMGLYTLTVREISQNPESEVRITSSMFTLRLFLVCMVAVLACLVAVFMPYNPLVKSGIIIGSFSMITTSLVQVLMGVFQKHLRLGRVAVAEVIARAMQLLIVFILVNQHSTGVLPYVWVAVAVGAAQLLLTVVFSRRLVPFRLLIDWDYWKRILVPAIPIALSLICTLIYFKIDTVMLSLMKSPADVGVYALGYKVLEIVIFFPAMYVGLVMPMLSQKANNPPEFKIVMRSAFKVLFVGALLSSVVLIAGARPIIHLVGGVEYGAGVAVLRILALAVAVIFFGNLGGNAIVALNVQKQGVWIYASGAVFNILANLVFIPRYSYYAAAWNTVATELLVTIGMFLLVRRALARDRDVAYTISHP